MQIPSLTSAAPLRGSLRHLACKLVVGGLAVDRLEFDPQVGHLPRRPADAELRGEAEHRVLDGRLRTASLRSLEWLEAEAAVTDRARGPVAVGEGHRRSLHPEPFIGERSEVSEGSTVVSLEDPLERARLLVGGPRVDDDPDL